MKIGTVFAWQNTDWDRYDSGDFSSPPPIPDSRVYAENIHLADLVEPLGFDSLFTVEHHQTPHHMTANGLQLLTHFAGRTERIDFGTCLIVLPWHHPVMVAEQICMFDNLLQGRRLWLGFGRGSSPREFNGLGFDMSESRDRFREASEIIRLALTEDHFSYEGTYYKFPNVTVRPRPYSPDLVDRLYGGAAGSPTSADIVADLDMKLMVVGSAQPVEAVAGMVDRYNDRRASNGQSRTHPIIVVWTYVAETEEKAWEGARKWTSDYVTYAGKHYLLSDPDAFKNIRGYEEYAQRAEAARSVSPEAAQEGAEGAARLSLWGTPDQVIEKIQQLADHCHTDHLVCFFNQGMMPVDAAERSMRLFAKEVLPVAQAIEPRPIGSTSVGVGT